MSNRSWFYASEGQQKGPFPEAQLHDLITRGIVRADTLVWTEGMAGWQKAVEIPGLVSGGSGPPAVLQAGGQVMAAGGYGGGALAADLPVWPLFGRTLLYIVGLVLIVPLPWIVTSLYRWLVSRLYVPGRPNLAFTGRVGDIWYVFIALALLIYVGTTSNYVQLVSIPIQAFLSWMIIRWVTGNLSSNGEPLPITFTGNVWTFIGWQVVLYLSFITIVGWAWVVTAMTRWICANISGTRREVIFNASGLEVLWRTIVFGIACAFLIPIPWMLPWYGKWYASQFAVVERGTYANA